MIEDLGEASIEILAGAQQRQMLDPDLDRALRSPQSASASNPTKLR
jgi:hypothetical protein